MAKTAPKLTRAAVMEALEQRIATGRAIQEAPMTEALQLAEAAVARLEWQHQAMETLRHLPKGNVAAFADFNRAAGQPSFELSPEPAEEAARMKQGLAAQLAVLEAALTRLKNSRTRRLDQG